MYCIDHFTQNCTGIEELSPSRYLNRKLFKDNIRTQLYPQESTLANLKEFLGSNYLLWPLPIEPSYGYDPQYWVDRWGEHVDTDGEDEEEEAERNELKKRDDGRMKEE